MRSKEKFVFIYVTTGSEEEARKISRHLLEKKLIACANYFPIQSVYSWKSKINESKEFALLVKTTEERSSKTKEEIEKIHSYQVPCVTRIKVEPNKKYGDWMMEQLEQK